VYLTYKREMGKAEVSSRVVGDMVITGLKERDHVAYISPKDRRQ
jgi:transcriptional regulator NrdR family protein